MKPFFGYDLTNKKINIDFNGKEFIVAVTNEALDDYFDDTVEDCLAAAEKSHVPKLLRIIMFIAGWLSAVCVCGIAGGMSDSQLSLTQAYAKAPEVFWVAGISGIIWLCLFIICRKKRKSAGTDTPEEEDFPEIDEVFEKVMDDLEVPHGARRSDIIAVTYKLKKGKVKPVKNPLFGCKYTFVPVSMFRDGSFLYLADEDAKFAFPIDSIKCITEVKDRIVIPDFDIPYKRGKNKKPGVRFDPFGRMYMKNCYILEFEHGGETWGIYFPCYELKTVESLTGKRLICNDNVIKN